VVFLDKYNFQIRVTGILIENKKILLVKQKIEPSREWSLPGGRVDAGEQLEEAINRELFEETGLITKVEKLLYICDKTDCKPPILHITFLLKKMSGEITLPTNEFDDNPISDVKYVDFSSLIDLGFSKKFVIIVKNGFPNAGSYMGFKENIGL
jgi:ADP-ribose pyrophosphatase YjhB (NUDIX family)